MSSLLPASAVPDVINRGPMHPEHLGNPSVSQRALANPQHFSLSQSGLCMPTALKHLSGIRSVGIYMKMRRLHADRPVARVQDAQSRRDGTVVDAIRSLVRADSLAVEPEHSVSVFVGCGRPVPASFGGRGGNGWITGHKPRKRFRFGHPDRAGIASPAKRVPMPSPSQIVGVAKISAPGGFRAAFYRAQFASDVGR